MTTEVYEAVDVMLSRIVDGVQKQLDTVNFVIADLDDGDDEDGMWADIQAALNEALAKINHYAVPIIEGIAEGTASD